MRRQKSAYFLAGDLWFCIEEDPTARAQCLPEYTHIAFSVSQNDFQTIANKIRAANTSIFKENKSEGDSIYFLDPTGHKLEIHVGNWKSRLEAYRGMVDTEFFDD
jgi:hypothetical protein